MTRDKCSAIIVAKNQTTYSAIRPLLTSVFSSVTAVPSLAAARQKLQTEDAVLIVNTPAADEFGVEGAIDLCLRKDVPVLLLVSEDVYERVCYRTGGTGIFVLTRPLNGRMLLESVKLLLSMRDRTRKLRQENERLSRRLEELGLVTRAKCVLIEKKGMTEEEAHRYLETEAMNHSLTKKEVAQEILSSFE